MRKASRPGGQSSIIANRNGIENWTVYGREKPGERCGLVFGGTLIERRAYLLLCIVDQAVYSNVFVVWPWSDVENSLTSLPNRSLKLQPILIDQLLPFMGEHADFLCLQPTSRMGLPLTTSHNVFRNSQIRLGSDMDVPSIATLATRMAGSLCGAVGDRFESDYEISSDFEGSWGGLFPHERHQRVKLRAIRCQGFVLREKKKEWDKSSSDPRTSAS
jgi:hypothetical protein